MNSLFDVGMVRNSNVARKALAFSLVAPKRAMRAFATTRDYANNPPIIVNSLPKSGTHLLLQITRALPSTRYFGGFIATTPSLTLKERSQTVLAKKICGLLPGETVGAHLYYSDSAAAAMSAINAVHLFIYRDPRDVLLSEVNYLADMNRWHRMHKVFSKIDDPHDRLKVAIEGFDDRYPDCAKRIAPFVGWLQHPETLSIKYEDLVGPNRLDVLGHIAAKLKKAGVPGAHEDRLIYSMEAAIDPGKSHTFREGGTEKWRTAMSAGDADRIGLMLAQELRAFGYVNTTQGGGN
ncbi:hypothetical protein [uncultured Devosia sp.]|uniref:hypothetical protein n=1 Tax=uncultured Devosia sp. TaxID=211434 RepID=UPI002615C9A7|nr:hypothetical protein [uncultured Devosia sp.]